MQTTPSFDWETHDDGYEVARTVVDGTLILLRANFYRCYIDIWRGRTRLVAMTLLLRGPSAGRDAAPGIVASQLELLSGLGQLDTPLSEQSMLVSVGLAHDSRVHAAYCRNCSSHSRALARSSNTLVGLTGLLMPMKKLARTLDSTLLTWSATAV
jgi:hypothetical protein